MILADYPLYLEKKYIIIRQQSKQLFFLSTKILLKQSA